MAEEEENSFTFYEFPPSMYRHIHTTNTIESLAEQCAAADTDQIDVFTTETSCPTIVWATLQDIGLRKILLQ